MQRASFFSYLQYRDVKIALLVNGLALLAYLLFEPEVEQYGGTWLGYTLGISGFLIILFCLAYAVMKRWLAFTPERRKVRDDFSSALDLGHIQDRRVAPLKRAYQSTRQGWLTSHVSLGGSLLLIVSLHTGFHFGWNVQTLAYTLMWLVVLTGLYGLDVYLRMPRKMTQNLAGDTFQTLFAKYTQEYEKASAVASQISPEILSVVNKARLETHIGGNVLQQLFPSRYACATERVLSELQNKSADLEIKHAKQYRELYTSLLTNTGYLTRLRTDIALRARLALWLYIHVPLALALLATMLAHILLVLFYW